MVKSVLILCKVLSIITTYVYCYKVHSINNYYKDYDVIIGNMNALLKYI